MRQSKLPTCVDNVRRGLTDSPIIVRNLYCVLGVDSYDCKIDKMDP